MLDGYPLLFCYGTLMRAHGGRWAERLAAMASLVGRGHVGGRLYVVGRYPGLVLHGAGTGMARVRGEVWRLAEPAKAWTVLDAYEGVEPGPGGPAEYRRVAVDVVMDDGGRIDCLAYEFMHPTDGLATIASGDFLDRED